MRSVLLTFGILTALTSPAQSQVDYYGQLGLTFATNLTRDAIVQEIEIRQSLAPTLVLGASLPFAPTYRAGLEATLTSSSYHSTELDVESELFQDLRHVLGVVAGISQH